MSNSSSNQPSAKAELAHVSNSFSFVIRAPLNRVAPLFGPNGERVWAGEHWNPEFLYPQPAEDIEGAVFTVRKGPHNSVWVNTLFDIAGGRMQYVYFIHDTLVTTVDVRLTSPNTSTNTPTTHVAVTYIRTALQVSANDEVRTLGDSDRNEGPHWQKAIEAYLSSH